MLHLSGIDGIDGGGIGGGGHFFCRSKAGARERKLKRFRFSVLITLIPLTLIPLTLIPLTLIPLTNSIDLGDFFFLLRPLPPTRQVL